jgi:hypothetical protein
VVEGYEQAVWVAAQRYQDAPWTELVMIWLTYNQHLARATAAYVDHLEHHLAQVLG